jgi:hypothetical protein
MPTPKKTPEAEPDVQEPARCGHINKHYHNPQGLLEDLACTLLAGHAGDHSAPCMKNVPEPTLNEKGQVVKTNYHAEPTVGYWSDAAGTPADQIQAGTIERMSLLQKDLVLQILTKDPGLSVPEAMQKARALPQWNAAELMS